MRTFQTAALAVLLASQAQAQVITSPFSPQNRPVLPFGYGAVSQQLVTSGSKTGTAWCQTWLGSSYQCISVSGGNACSATVPAGELVSCNAAGTPPVDESAFASIDCGGLATGPLGPLGPEDWCQTANLEPSRTVDTIYLYSDYVRVGLNRRFGGTIFELYGTDERNRIMQNGGGAMQLSLWGNDVTYAPPGSTLSWFQLPTSQTSCNAIPYATAQKCATQTGGICQEGLVGANDTDCVHQFACYGGNAAPGAAINPIQAVSAGCEYGVTPLSNDEARVSKVFSPGPGIVTAKKHGPQQYTKSTNLQVRGLTWLQTMQVTGPFASVSYHITYNGMDTWNADFQEIPALLTGQGMSGGTVYYYAGNKPYADPTSPVTSAFAGTDATTQVYQLPNRSGPFGAGVPPGYGAFLTEEWVSLCDATQTRCITIASFAPDAQDLIYGPGDYAYFGLHGFFGIVPGLNKTIQVYVAPYRFDDVVEGQTVRQWIYSLRNQ